MFAAKNNTNVSNVSPSVNNNGGSAFIQPKLNVGKPGDKYEVEADKAADQIVANGNQPTPFFPAAPSVQKQADEDLQQQPVVDSISSGIQLKENCLLQKTEEKQPEDDLQMMTEEASLQTKKELENHIPTPITNLQPMFAEDVQTKGEEDLQEKEEDNIQTLQKQTNGDEGSVSPSLENNLSYSKGGGSPLTSDTRHEMESGFGTDFSGVRVHNDTNSVQMNQQLGSQAFTNGNDVYFNEGKYNPGSDSGKHLLAHELTHTVQQGASVQAKMIQKTESPDETDTVTEPTSPIDITNGLQLSEEWLTYIETNSRQSKFMVPVKIGEQFTGTIALKKLGRAVEGSPRKFELNSSKRENYLDVGGMEFLNPLRNLGVHPILVLKSFGEEQQTSGFLSIRKGEEALTRDVLGVIKGINENLEAMSFLGLSPIEGAEGLQNEFTSGGLNFNANNLSLNVDGYLDAQASIGITNSNFTFEVNAAINVAGLAEGELKIARGEDGGLSGNATINADIANVSATVQVDYDRGAVIIQGTGRMNSEKFSGEITFLVTDAAKSQQMMHAALGVTAMDAEAEQASTSDAAPVAKTKDNQVLAGWGTVQASITSWLEGTASIGIDNEGHVTIVGEIVVPDEIELMELRGKKTDLFNLEIRAGYGIPLVGQVFLFASIGMFVNAGFGPLVLKNVGFTGTYSTDPNVLQQFSITGTLGINAFAIIGLEAEAGVGVTIIGHDIKAGVNVTAAAGIKAYAEATPTFEYSESQAPEGGKVGESHLRGHFEAAAQLFLQLTGALFYELDSPWWSPAPDGREESPLGEVQYPIGDSMGIGADIDWLVGSPDVPELTFSPVEFDPEKFTADVMADPPPRTMGNADAEPEGGWTDEHGGNQNENPEITGDGEGLPPNSRRDEDLSNLPDEQKYMRALDELSRLESANPKSTIRVVDAEMRKVKRKYGITKIETRDEQETQVSVYVEHARENNSRHLLNIPLMSHAERTKLMRDAKEALKTGSQNAADAEGKITRSNAENVLTILQRNHPVIVEARVVDGRNTWNYLIDMGDREETENGNIKAEDQTGENTVDEHLQNTEGEVENIIGLTAPVNIDGGHSLKLEGTVQRVEKNVYSEKKSLVTLIRDKETEIDENGALDPDFEAKKFSITNLKSEIRLLDSNIAEYKGAVDNAYQTGHGNKPVGVAYDKIQTNLINIAADLIVVGILPDEFDMPVSDVQHTLVGGKAKTLTAQPISQRPGNTRGSTPTQNPKGWSQIPLSLRSNGAWVRAHLLNHRLHGPGVNWNLFPGTRKMNLDDMESQVESKGKKAVWDEGKVIYYHVNLTYGNKDDFQDIPTQVAMEVGEYDMEKNSPDTSKVIVAEVFNQEPPSEIQTLSFNNTSAGALKKVASDNNVSGLQGIFFDILVSARNIEKFENPSDIGNIKNIENVRTKIPSFYRDDSAFDSAFSKLKELIIKTTITYD